MLTAQESNFWVSKCMDSRRGSVTCCHICWASESLNETCLFDASLCAAMNGIAGVVEVAVGVVGFRPKLFIACI